MFDAYGGSAFPGIGDILYNINEEVKTDLPFYGMYIHCT